MRCLLIFLSILFAHFTKAESSQHVMPVDSDVWMNEDLAHYWSEEELVSITVNESPLKVIFQNYMSSEKQGIAIILPEIGDPLLKVNGTQYLHEALTDDGFDTYLIPSPKILFESLEIPDFSSQNVPEMHFAKATYFQSEEMLNEYKSELASRFQALSQTLTKTRDELVVVIAIGTTAGVFAELLSEQPSLPVDALVTISAKLPHPKRNKDLSATFSLISPPLLDIYYSHDGAFVMKGITDRLRWARRNNKLDYRQRELFGQSHELRQHERLRKEVNGFLSHL